MLKQSSALFVARIYSDSILYLETWANEVDLSTGTFYENFGGNHWLITNGDIF